MNGWTPTHPLDVAHAVTVIVGAGIVTNKRMVKFAGGMWRDRWLENVPADHGRWGWDTVEHWQIVDDCARAIAGHLTAITDRVGATDWVARITSHAECPDGPFMDLIGLDELTRDAFDSGGMWDYIAQCHVNPHPTRDDWYEWLTHWKRGRIRDPQTPCPNGPETSVSAMWDARGGLDDGVSMRDEWTDAARRRRRMIADGRTRFAEIMGD